MNINDIMKQAHLSFDKIDSKRTDSEMYLMTDAILNFGLGVINTLHENKIISYTDALRAISALVNLCSIEATEKVISFVPIKKLTQMKTESVESKKMTSQHYAKTILFTLHNIKDMSECKFKETKLLENLSITAFTQSQKIRDITEVRKFKAMGEYLLNRNFKVSEEIFQKNNS